jgi:hypothetical protein
MNFNQMLSITEQFENMGLLPPTAIAPQAHWSIGTAVEAEAGMGARPKSGRSDQVLGTVEDAPAVVSPGARCGGDRGPWFYDPQYPPDASRCRPSQPLPPLSAAT